MKRSLFPPCFTLLILFVTPAAYALTPAHLWSQRYGSTGTEEANAVAVDAAGNIIIAGSFLGTADFGGGALVSAGSRDVFVAKYDASGAHLWSKRFGSTLSDECHDMVLDSGGNVHIVGSFVGTVSFGGPSLLSAGATDVFYARYFGSDGSYLASQRFGGADYDYAYGVGVDPASNYVIAGSFRGTADFGGGNLVSAGQSDIFVTQYDLFATHQWSQRFGSAQEDEAFALALDASGNPHLTGIFHGSVDFGGGVIASHGGQDMFLAKYDAAGAHQWSHGFGGISTDRAYAVTVDGSGNVFFTGYYRFTADFGGGNLTANGLDAFLAKYDANGAHQWSQDFGAGGNEIGNALAADASGAVTLTGSYTAPADFGTGVLSNAGLEDMVLARYDAGGSPLWSGGFGGASTDEGTALYANAAGYVLVTGGFYQSVDFGGGALASAGGREIVLARYAPGAAEPLITSISDIGSDQGGKVKIRFDRSGVDDALAGIPVTRYVALRRDDAAPAAVAPGGVATHADGWTEVGSVSAFAEDSYGIDVPTIGDSTIALGQYHSVFYIRAATDVPSRFYDSAADSGYSLDNLAPGVPGSLLYSSGVLSWDESPAEDFDYFTVYGSNSDSFGASTLVDYTVAPGMDVTASSYVYYFVTATDFSGNEGPPASLNTLTGAGGAPNYTLSVGNHPNPFNPTTRVRYTVPATGLVSVTVYDARGARVATLVDNEYRTPGVYRAEWRGRDDRDAPVASGVYFARVEQAGAAKVAKMVLLK